MTILLTKAKTTTGAPSASNLTIGNGSTTFGAELAVNTADKKLYSKDSTSAVVEIAGALHAYPVGAVYISVVATSPATLFGGTWDVFGAGRALVSLDSTDTDFDTAEEERGAKTVGVSVDTVIPTTGYGLTGSSGGALINPTTSGALIVGDGTTDSSDRDDMAHATSPSAVTSSTTTVSVIQPSIVVYMWKRTA
jgi:hypothetical protein